jgi:cytochrome c-type biogenesis protein CcmH
MRRWLALLLLLAVSATFADELAPQHESRYRALVQELRCLVCQNQSIADSNAPLAQDLRDQVRSQLVAGKSDREIMDYLTARYGDFVLYRPRFKATTALLWLAPAILILIGAVMAVRFARARRVVATPPIDQAKLERLLKREGRP